MKVGYLGPTASFTHTAALQSFPSEELVSFNSIYSCIKGLELGKVDNCIVPIENTIEGTVNTTLDYLYHKTTVSVVAEVVLPISQQFMVHKSDEKDWLKSKIILSHPQALGQCQEFIGEYFPNAITESTPSTSYGAEFISHHPGQGYAAIAPKMSADSYQLVIVKENIQDVAANKTRFWILGSKETDLTLPKTKEKISISITMPNNMPGALHKALSAFSWRQINLTKIESRPLKTVLGEYFFLIDILNDQPFELVKNALAEIELLGGKVKIFGNYKVYVIAAI